jgi:replication factor C small subunit
MAIGDVPFKIIYLDECDSLTKEAQQALRRTMENYVASTRFILSANFSSKIIDPIQSRCTVFRFRPLEKEHVKTVIGRVAESEGLNIKEDAIEALYDITNGDVRRLTNILQSCSSLSKDITVDVVYGMVSAARPKEVREVLELAINGDFIKARNQLLDVMLQHGLAGLDIIKQIQKEVWNLDIPDEKKVMLVDKCGEIEFRMVEGSDEFVQMEALLANFIQ